MPDTGILDFEMSELLLSRIFFGNCFRLLNAMDRRVCTTGFHVILFFPRKKPHVSHEVFRRPRVVVRLGDELECRICALGSVHGCARGRVHVCVASHGGFRARRASRRRCSASLWLLVASVACQHCWGQQARCWAWAGMRQRVACWGFIALLRFGRVGRVGI